MRERIFMSLCGPGDRDSYTVVAVEYFISNDPLWASHTMSSGIRQITVYIETSEQDFTSSPVDAHAF